MGLLNNEHRLFLIVNYFNLLIKTITKYKILKKRENDNTKLTKLKQIKKLYDKALHNSLTILNLNINIKLLGFLLRDLDSFTQVNNFNFLKLNITPKINIIINNYKVQSNLYFTNSFKELIKFKYNFTKTEKDKRRSQSQTEIFKNK